jgi:hypothetical protein
MSKTAYEHALKAENAAQMKRDFFLEQAGLCSEI